MYHALRGAYGLSNHPTTQIIGKFVEKLKETGMVNIERPVHYRFARSAENIAVVCESIAEEPNAPIPSRSQELGLSYGTWCICIKIYIYIHVKSSSRNN